MTDFEALVLLNMVEGIGSTRLKKLLDIFGSAPAIFDAQPHKLSLSGILTPRMIKGISEASRKFKVAEEIAAAHKKGVSILTILDDDYPLNLKEIYDPPIVLYVKGKLIEADRNAVGIVGSRGASFYGLSCAKDFSSRLAQFGLTIVSGMARGIDTTSHRAALDAKGRTIAVLGSGLNNIYPPENEMLFEEIAQHGAVISQFPMNTAPLAINFPIRNRIISGLSQGVLVVEASYKSGALITARYCLEQGREVFAIPGKLSSETSCGTNDLIKQGAKMVTTAEEILEDLKNNFYGISNNCRAAGQQASKQNLFNFNDQESSLINILDDEPKYVDVLSDATGMNTADILSILMRLELKGIVKQLPGKTFVRNN